MQIFQIIMPLLRSYPGHLEAQGSIQLLKPNNKVVLIMGFLAEFLCFVSLPGSLFIYNPGNFLPWSVFWMEITFLKLSLGVKDQTGWWLFYRLPFQSLRYWQFVLMDNQQYAITMPLSDCHSWILHFHFMKKCPSCSSIFLVFHDFSPKICHTTPDESIVVCRCWSSDSSGDSMHGAPSRWTFSCLDFVPRSGFGCAWFENQNHKS